MKDMYRGHAYGLIKCSNFDELKEVLQNGECFRVSNMPWYFRAIPFQAPSGVNVENVAYLRRVCTTSVTTKFTSFYHIEKSDDSSLKVYKGKELEDLICDELNKWIKNLNPKTLKAFSGKSFVSYLNAIPQELLINENFAKKVKKTITNGCVKRVKSADSEEIIENFYTISESSKKIIDEQKKRGFENSSNISEKSLKNLEEIKAKMIKEMRKN